MKTDIEIAQEATPLKITEIAQKCGVDEKYIEQYGNYKAKIDYRMLKDLADKPDGKLILVTAITPTPAGEGKTTTSVGLADGLRKIGKNAVVALREPSLGPVFGVKGGAAGGGYAQVVPMEDINLHFTGDFHAIGAANNLLAAMLDNHIQQGNTLGIDVKQITWKRAVDMNDRQLRHIVDGLGGKVQGVPREDGFEITVASEIMAVLCLSSDIIDLKTRLARMIVAYTYDGKPVTAVRKLTPEEIDLSVRRVARIVKIGMFMDRYPSELSGGQQQRVALARALVNNPDLLIADEPTGNIDPELSYEIVELLDEINKTGTTILMVTHEHELVNRFHHRTVTLEKGRIIRDQGGASHV